MIDTFILRGKTTDTYENLAMEHAIMSWINDQSILGKSIYGLFLWQSKNAIVFGRNQNIYKECDMKTVKEHDIVLVRRETGGGAVYHDMGNLCFTFFDTKDISDRNRNFKIVIEALKKLGINAEKSGRNDITVAGKKVSGNAFRRVGNAELHHGTILVNVNLELAGKCLTPNDYKLKSKGVDSVKSRIVNLSDIRAHISVEAVENIIVDVFSKELVESVKVMPEIDDRVWRACYDKLKSNDWIFRKDLSGQRSLNGEWGIFDYTIIENGGYIEDVQYESDILDTDMLDSLIERFRGTALSIESIVKILSEEILLEEEPCMNGLLRSLVKDIASRLE